MYGSNEAVISDIERVVKAKSCRIHPAIDGKPEQSVFCELNCKNHPLLSILLMMLIINVIRHVVFALAFWTLFGLISCFVCLVAFILFVLCLPLFLFTFSTFTVEFIDESLDHMENKYFWNHLKYEARRFKLNFSIPLEHQETANVSINISHVPVRTLVHRGDMVLIHGTAGSCASFIHVIDDLSEMYNIFVLDLPGFGRSTVDSSFLSIRAAFPNSMEFLVQVVVECINRLKLKQIVLVGHSFGAYICVKVVETYPSKVSRLVLMDPAGVFPTLGSSGAFYAVLFKMSIPNIGKIFGRFGYMLMTFYEKSCSEVLYWYYLTSHPRGIGDKFVADQISLSMFSASWKIPLMKVLVQLSCPIDLIYGECDNIMPPQQGIILFELLSHVNLHVICLASHSPISTKLDGKSVSKVLLRVEDFKEDAGTSVDDNLMTKLLSLDLSSFSSSFDWFQTDRMIINMYGNIGKLNEQEIDLSTERFHVVDVTEKIKLVST
jgi:pimeloyl-ACP methyl ester carboxylesterase